MSSAPVILDACCGSRMMWFDKDNPAALFADIRQESHTLCDGRPLEIKPDVVADFRAMPFEDAAFWHVVFDPPHLKKLGKTSWLAKKYGRLLPTWEDDIREGFAECWRVLKPGGTLIFKWNQNEIPLSKILPLLSQAPEYGHTSRKNGETVWMSFVKRPAPTKQEGSSQPS
jgi:ubiquinone/menaquinone biosynthesis C-methylase UbiE